VKCVYTCIAGYIAHSGKMQAFSSNITFTCTVNFA